MLGILYDPENFFPVKDSRRYKYSRRAFVLVTEGSVLNLIMGPPFGRGYGYVSADLLYVCGYGLDTPKEKWWGEGVLSFLDNFLDFRSACFEYAELGVSCAAGFRIEVATTPVPQMLAQTLGCTQVELRPRVFVYPDRTNLEIRDLGVVFGDDIFKYQEIFADK